MATAATRQAASGTTTSHGRRNGASAIRRSSPSESEGALARLWAMARSAYRPRAGRVVPQAGVGRSSSSRRARRAAAGLRTSPPA